LGEAGLGQIVDSGARPDHPDLDGRGHLVGGHEIFVQIDQIQRHVDSGLGAFLTADGEPEDNGQKDGKEFQEPIAF
jgi:hypothetical protein